MSDAAMIVAGAIACLGLAGAGSAFGTGFAASAALASRLLRPSAHGRSATPRTSPRRSFSSRS